MAVCTDAGLSLLAYDGAPYEPNLPITIANADEAAGFKESVIDRTLEPTIMAGGQIISMGKVILRERSL